MALVPASSRGGSTFNGGTITQPLTVLETNGTSKGIVINTQGGFGVNAFEIDAPHTTVMIDGDGVVTFSSDDNIGVNLVGTAGSDASLSVSSNSGTNSAGLDSVAGFTLNVPGTRVFTLGELFMFHLNAAPADGDLEAGDCALWFDQTNGAAATKLMVKGKSADGTVKTAAIVLT